VSRETNQAVTPPTSIHHLNYLLQFIAIISYIMARTSFIWWDDDGVCLVL